MTAALPAGMSREDLIAVNWVNRVRFETDELALDWVTDGGSKNDTDGKDVAGHMSYESFETSSERGLKATLFLIEYGTGREDYFAYTDYTAPITYQNRIYEPVPVKRGTIESVWRTGATVVCDQRCAEQRHRRIYRRAYSGHRH